MNTIPKKYLDEIFKDVELILNPNDARERGWIGFYIGDRCILGFPHTELRKYSIPNIDWYSEGPFFTPIIEMFSMESKTFYEILVKYLNERFDCNVTKIF